MEKTTVDCGAMGRVDVPEEWIELVTRDVDLFMSSYCGYWAFGVRPEATDDVWLVFEQADGPGPSEEDIARAEQAYTKGEPLPKGWTAFDRAFALRAYVEGARKKGVGWYYDADANDLDCVIQRAALGELRYG